MDRQRVYRTEAVVLHRLDLGEADKILTLLTPGLGKIRVVAKGVRRPGSRLGGHVDLLTHASMMLAKGQNLDVVTQSQTINSFLALRDDLERTARGIYLAEIADQFLPERQENGAVFRLLTRALDWLCDARNPDVAVRYAEVQLLDHLGYRPELRDCVRCRTPLRPEVNGFSASAGGVLCPDCRSSEPLVRPLSVTMLKVLRHLQTAPYEEVSRLRLEGSLRFDLELLLREYIRYLLDRSPKSVEFLDTLRSRESAGGGQRSAVSSQESAVQGPGPGDRRPVGKG
ncbi:MAG: DNA repair protein RecO [Chloroflexi bacterium]|nr:DNA repair protein RecO [Chloroflexota bacterium]